MLNLFQGSYESAVSTAHDGLRDSRAVADKVRDAFIDSRDDYLDTDEATYDRFRALAPDPSGFPPYDPAGSGNDTPGAPLSDAPQDDTSIPDLEDKHPGISDGASAIGDKVKPGNDVDKPPAWMDPQKAAADAATDAIERRTDEYQYYRSLGYSDEEALQYAKTDGSTAAPTRSTTTGSTAPPRVPTTPSTTGRSPRAPARRTPASGPTTPTPTRARATPPTTTVVVTSARRRRTYTDLYDEGKQIVDNVNDLVDNVNEIGDNADDLGEYDDYQSQDEDQSAQEWAGR